MQNISLYTSFTQSTVLLEALGQLFGHLLLTSVQRHSLNPSSNMILLVYNGANCNIDAKKSLKASLTCTTDLAVIGPLFTLYLLVTARLLNPSLHVILLVYNAVNWNVGIKFIPIRIMHLNPGHLTVLGQLFMQYLLDIMPHYPLNVS
jgi:hypothetical protein